MSVELILLLPRHASRFRSHMQRHRAESGENGFHFMPFAPNDTDGPKGVDFNRIEKPLSEPGWQRSFAYINEAGDIVGHVHLKGELLKSLSHRCWLELGVEKEYRRQNLGFSLCQEAISYARDTARLDWIDLYTFAHNTPARALYKKLGFYEVGISIDKIRIGDVSIDDVQMTLPLRGQLGPVNTI